MAENNSAALIEALDNHTETESAGDGGKGKVACWLTGDAIAERREAAVNNLTLLADAYGYDYERQSLESSGCIVVFSESDE